MDQNISNSSTGYLQILLLLGFLVPAVLFILTEQNTLKLIQPINRTMRPGQVWLQMIPLFGLFYQFTVVTQISRSLQREFDSYFNDSNDILPAAETHGRKGGRGPLYSSGMAYCWLISISVVVGYALPSLSLLRTPIVLAATIYWIVYWVQLAGYKKKLRTLRPA
jgi:hypothetical protein